MNGCVCVCVYVEAIVLTCGCHKMPLTINDTQWLSSSSYYSYEEKIDTKQRLF